MENTILQEATLNEICEELSHRNINYIFTSKSYSGSSEDELPILAIGVRTQDIAEMIGITDIAKSKLIDEFKISNYIVEDDEEC